MIRLFRIATLLAALAGVAVALAPEWATADASRVSRLARTLAEAEAKDGKSSPNLLPVLERLAQAHVQDGALAEAVALRRRALAIAIAAFGGGSPRAVDAMVALSAVDIDRGEYLDAEPLLVIARALLGDDGSVEQAAMPAILTGLARVALARGDAVTAEAWAMQSVAAAKSQPGDAAGALRTLGIVLTVERRFPEAEKLLNEALAQDRLRHGENSIEAARNLSALANLDLRRGRPAAALPLIEQATAIDQRLLGATHPFIADDFHDLGLVYEALDRIDDASRALQFALGVFRRGAGRDALRAAYTEIDLSRVLRHRGDATAADAAFSDSRRILRRAAAAERKRERSA